MLFRDFSVSTLTDLLLIFNIVSQQIHSWFGILCKVYFGYPLCVIKQVFTILVFVYYCIFMSTLV